MNVLFFLTPKANCTYIYEDFTIRQALERMEPSRFASIPILKRTGEYVGTITEGDLLWAIKNNYTMNMKDAESRPVQEVARRKDYRPVPVTTGAHELLKMAVEQNFVPMVDDKDSFIGIVTRQKLMQYCLEQYFESREGTA
jgi:CBS domain-containing protein